jgi:hypothetical protein
MNHVKIKLRSVGEGNVKNKVGNRYESDLKSFCFYFKIVLEITTSFDAFLSENRIGVPYKITFCCCALVQSSNKQGDIKMASFLALVCTDALLLYSSLFKFKNRHTTKLKIFP